MKTPRTSVLAAVVSFGAILHPGANAPGVESPPAYTTLLATIVSTTQHYASPTSNKPNGFVAPTWEGAPSVLPVIKQTPGWLDVRLSPRPNGSTAWIKSTGVRFSYTPYSIVISLRSTHLMLFKYDKEVGSYPVGIGTTALPTPTGSYFVAYVGRPPGYGYGPFVLVTSAHSNIIQNWAGTGDANIGIHGPIGTDVAIGKTGVKESHGCIRMHLQDQAKLSVVTAGTPISIIN